MNHAVHFILRAFEQQYNRISQGYQVGAAGKSFLSNVNGSDYFMSLKWNDGRSDRIGRIRPKLSNYIMGRTIL